MKLFAGFDVGGTNARLSLYDERWTSVGQARVQVRDATSPDEIARALVDLLGTSCDSHLLKGARLEAVGLGLAGQLSADGEVVVNAPNLGWRDVRFAEMLCERIEPRYGQVTVRVVNDLSALLWGEHARGAVQDVRDVLAVYVGTGIGGGILANGVLLSGAGGKAGEIGHSKVVVGGRLCGCGERGCVEAYAGGVHLERQVAEIAREHAIAQVLTHDARVPVDLAVADALSETLAPLDELWSQATDYLAVVLANACTLLNPAVLLLGGGVLENCPNFRARILTKTTPLILASARDDLEIRFPTLGDEAGVLGAAALATGSSQTL